MYSNQWTITKPKQIEGFSLSFKETFDLENILLINLTEYELFGSFADSLPNKDILKWNIHNIDIANIKTNIDLLVWEFPFGIKNIWNEESKYRGFTGEQVMILKTMWNISSNWFAIFPVTINTYSSEIGKRFIKELNKNWFFINAIFDTPPNILNPLTGIKINLLVISKGEVNKIFIAELNENTNFPKMLKKFKRQYLNKKTVSIESVFADLEDFKDKEDKEPGILDWILAGLEDFGDFGKYKVKRQITQLESQYKDFESYELKKIAISIKLWSQWATFIEKKNTVYIPKIWNSNVFSDIQSLKLKHHNYYEVILDEKVANANFVRLYLNSDMGKLNLNYLMTWGIIQIINKAWLESISIPLLPLDKQKYIVDTDIKIQNLKTTINKFEEDIALNPMNSSKIQSKLDDLLNTLNILSSSDKVLSLVRQWESKTTEFKQTLKINIITKQKDKEMEKMVLKTIVAFLNSDWWTLLVWVKDNWEIYWIENDDYKNNDDYLKHFHNLIRDKIGEGFFPLVDYNIVDINQNKVLLVDCQRSDTACYYEGKEFFVRTNPATDKLEWAKMMEYINKRFKV